MKNIKYYYRYYSIFSDPHPLLYPLYLLIHLIVKILSMTFRMTAIDATEDTILEYQIKKNQIDYNKSLVRFS